MATREWEIIVWQRASHVLQQAERIQRNFLQIAVGAQYEAPQGRGAWQPALNVVESESSLWIIAAVAGVALSSVEVRLDGHELVLTGQRPAPECCHDGELKLWEIPLGRFERRLRVLDQHITLELGGVNLKDGLLIVELRKKS